MVDTFDDELAILEHVARYRITTPAILAGALCDDSESQAKSLLDSLASGGCLAEQPLSLRGEERCFRLSEKAADYLKIDPKVAAPLQSAVRAERYAIARFCCCGGEFRQLFTRAEFVSAFGHLWYTGQPTAYYLEPSSTGSARLAFLKVDGTSPGRWDRLIASCQGFVAKRSDVRKAAPEYRRQVEAFAQLIGADRFQISVLTALPDKKRAIELELDRRRCAGEAIPPIHVYVIPGLLDLLAPSRPPTQADSRTPSRRATACARSIEMREQKRGVREARSLPHA